jgi:hypothetical protein
MRKTVLLFGFLVDAGVVALVAYHGYSTADTTITGVITAFLFGAIAVGGFGGHAVAVHLWRTHRVWGLVLGITACAALTVNLTNSLGAIAGRSDKTQAERAKAADVNKNDQAELSRLMDERAKLPAFRPIGTVKADIDGARAGRAYKISGGCQPEQITTKATRESCDAYRKLVGELAAAEEATHLDGAIAGLRGKLDKAPAINSANPQAAVLAQLFRISFDDAATRQQLAVAVVVELLIVMSFVASERFRGVQVSAPASTERAGELLAEMEKAKGAPVENKTPVEQSAGNVVSLVVKAPPKPSVLVASMLKSLPRSVGEQVSWAALYAAFRKWCVGQKIEPLDVAAFGRELKALCEYAGIRTRAKGDDVFCLDVRLAA